MNDLLANPAIQSGIGPFVVALVAFLVLRLFAPLYHRLGASLAVWIGFFAGVELITDIVFTPFTSTRKVLLVALIAVIISIVVQASRSDNAWTTPAAFVGAAISMIWILWPVLTRRSGTEFWGLALAGPLYAGWLAASLDGLKRDPERALGTSAALAFGTGGAALLGASALLGSLGIALGSSIAAPALWALYKNEARAGTALLVPAGLIAGLIGFSALVYAKVPWFALLPLAAVPLVGRLPIGSGWPLRARLLATGILTLVVSLAAVGLTWSVAGGVPM